ncbi:MAG: hypothetical protein AB2784_10370 [Candidatus Thiodiazotropha endolucinida]
MSSCNFMRMLHFSLKIFNVVGIRFDSLSIAALPTIQNFEGDSDFATQHKKIGRQTRTFMRTSSVRSGKAAKV